MHGAHGFPGTGHLPYAWELAELFREGQGGDGRADGIGSAEGPASDASGDGGSS